jgi:hypothetical protein
VNQLLDRRTGHVALVADEDRGAARIGTPHR